MNDFWVLNTYFNPLENPARKLAFETSCAKLLEQGANLLSVELAFRDAAHQLSGRQQFLRLRTNSLLWHHERLLNFALATLPEECTHVAWIDGDLLLRDDNWIAQARDALADNDVVQLYQTIEYLDADGNLLQSKPSMASMVAREGKKFLIEKALQKNIFATPGGALAARREVLRAGFYERLIFGGGDDVFFRTLVGAVDLMPRLTSAQTRDIRRWEVEFFGTNDSYSLAYLPNTAQHLWHGPLEDRQYWQKQQRLKDLDFSPTSDLSLEPDSGLYQVSSLALKASAERYFSTLEASVPPSLAALGISRIDQSERPAATSPIAVLTPCYNQAALLQRMVQGSAALAAVHIILDDGSDHPITPEDFDSPVIILRRERESAAAFDEGIIREALLNAARIYAPEATWLLWLDSDDLLEVDSIEAEVFFNWLTTLDQTKSVVQLAFCHLIDSEEEAWANYPKTRNGLYFRPRLFRSDRVPEHAGYHGYHFNLIPFAYEKSEATRCGLLTKHFGNISAGERQRRYERYRRLDPTDAFQDIGYEHLASTCIERIAVSEIKFQLALTLSKQR